MFFNELDMLDLRLHEHTYVDKFVIVEGTKTFSGLDKELYFDNNKHLFKEFEDKIIHLVVDDMPIEGSAWDRERHTLNAIKRLRIKDDDIVLIGAVDEIIKKVYPGLNRYKTKLFYYYFNHAVVHLDGKPVWNEVVCSVDGATLSKYSVFEILNERLKNVLDFTVRERGGWHFSCVGSPDFIRQKIESWSHQEFNTEEMKSSVERKIKEHKYLFGDDQFKIVRVDLDNSFPKYLSNNKERFKEYIDV
jgi:beta-1,4-mannosyl-glycoprotein beta-1,4-N-acetylglucosaminyltransferase